MREKILFVDDDPNILNSMRRNLRNRFNLSTSESGEQGLRAIEKEGPFAVVVSDLKMPGMNGIDFLARVRDLSKDTVRVMLTGYAELESAISAVNEGNVFRFLTKPCDMSTLVNTLVQCLEQYRLITAERELLDKTLSGSVELCSEILSMVNPVAFDTSSRIKRYVRYIAEHKDPENLWQYEIAAMLSQIGCVTLKPETLEKVAENRPLNGEEQQVYDMHPTIAYDLLSRIPRMAGVAKMIMYQNKNYDGTGNPREKIAGEDIPLGARILKLVLDYDMHLSQMKSPKEAFAEIEKDSDLYDPELMYYLEGMLGVEARFTVKKLSVAELSPGMITNQEVRSASGLLIMRKSYELTNVILSRLRAYAQSDPIREPVSMLVP